MLEVAMHRELFTGLKYSGQCPLMKLSWNEVMLQWQNHQPRLEAWVNSATWACKVFHICRERQIGA
jgi:hypothetical protein